MSALIPPVITAFGRRLLGLRGALGGLFGIGADGLPRIVAAGTNGQYLVARPANADGVAWETVATGSGFTAGVSTGPNGSTDSRTTGSSSYNAIRFEVQIMRPFLKITAVELVLPPGATCTLYINGISQGDGTNGGGSHAAVTYTIPGGGIYLPAGTHWFEVVRTSGTSEWRDAGSPGGTDSLNMYGTGDFGLLTQIFYGSGISAFGYIPACRLTYVPYDWEPA